MTCLLGLGVLGLSVYAQTVRLGAEFQVNSYTTSYQQAPHVSRNGMGMYVVVWQSLGQDGSGWGVFGQRYTNNGVKQGSEFQVNTYTTGDQYAPSVSMQASGDFVVAWQSEVQDGSQGGIYAQRFNGSGAKVGSEFRVNTYTTNDQADASVDYDGSGNFVVAWDSSCGTAYPCTGQDGAYSGIYAQRYGSGGATAGSEFRANTYTRDDQSYPSVSKADNGKFVVVWQSYQDGMGQNFNYGIYGQVYAADGTKTMNEFNVNTYTSHDQTAPAVSLSGSGSFVVVWQSYGQFGVAGYDVVGQRYSSSNAKVGGEFQVNSYTTNDQAGPAVAMDRLTGKFVVVWRSFRQLGSAFASEIYGQRYNADGTRHGVEFLVNTNTISDQRQPSVDMNDSSDFVVTWASAGGQDGSMTGVFGQLFSNTDCPALSVPAPANQTSCPGSTAFFTVNPSGLAPYTYQWQKNGVNISNGVSFSGTNTSVLRIKQVAAGDNGSTYRCVASDWCLPPASTTSSTGTLTVTGGQSAGQVTNLKIQKINSGANLKLIWNNTTNATDYVVYEATSPNGAFTTQTGTSTSGLTGLTIALPSGNREYLVAGRNSACGVGPM